MKHNQRAQKEGNVLGIKNGIKLEKSRMDKAADFMTAAFGTTTFLIANATFFLVWIIWNSSIIPGVTAFDPFPFGFLTMVVSLEAIFLSIIVLISQNRASQISDMRQELDFEVNVRAEEEITRIIKMLDEIHDHLGLDPNDDPELTKMKQKIDITELGNQILRNNK